ncbi:hypothetical protein [Sphingobacterium sp. IITKGP-BTPF85]|uniref:hypothetical protein n=1 Tax=Sphingobacterium sp. IITKGP-BTPF85 TaxID=1338009 RepID=UPI00038A1DB7|nr:hypothetical protein [Sphingobacterium sp. IITKGP-BTPF85]KKX46649.1 hypothetical protein L950_0230770 [Sphingobacterium sp. IITKGP-BTPF85]
MKNYLQPNSQTKWNFFIEMGDGFTIRYLSQHYPFNSLQIESISNHLDWYNLSNNPCMTFELVDAYKRKLNFGNLLNNNSLIWTNELLTKYYKFIDKNCYTYRDFIEKRGFKGNSQNTSNSKLSRFSNLSQEEIESMIMEFSNYFELSHSKEILWNDQLLSLMKISQENIVIFIIKKYPIIIVSTI